jgi:hypothetical protein
MTFILALARPDFALLAADTRSTVRDGPDLPATAVTDDGVKLFPFRAGWLASSPCVAWREALLEGACPADVMRELEASSPDIAQVVRERQLTLIVDVGADGCVRQALDWRGVERFPGSMHVAVILAPNGSDVTLVRAQLRAFQATIADAPLPLVQAAVARFYRWMYGHCGPDGTVSPLLSIGLVYPDGGRELLGPFPHDAFLSESEVAHV